MNESLNRPQIFNFKTISKVKKHKTSAGQSGIVVYMAIRKMKSIKILCCIYLFKLSCKK